MFSQDMRIEASCTVLVRKCGGGKGAGGGGDSSGGEGNGYSSGVVGMVATVVVTFPW